jgi:hypothetical protein
MAKAEAVLLAVIAIAVSQLPARGQDVYASTPCLIQACRNISASNTWMDRFKSGQFKQDDIGVMNGAWSDARACYTYPVGLHTRKRPP